MAPLTSPGVTGETTFLSQPAAIILDIFSPFQHPLQAQHNKNPECSPKGIVNYIIELKQATAADQLGQFEYSAKD